MQELYFKYIENLRLTSEMILELLTDADAPVKFYDNKSHSSWLRKNMIV